MAHSPPSATTKSRDVGTERTPTHPTAGASHQQADRQEDQDDEEHHRWKEQLQRLVEAAGLDPDHVREEPDPVQPQVLHHHRRQEHQEVGADEGDVPGVDELQVGRLGDVGARLGEEGRHDEDAGQGHHDAVLRERQGKDGMVNVEVIYNKYMYYNRYNVSCGSNGRERKKKKNDIHLPHILYPIDMKVRLVLVFQII